MRAVFENLRAGHFPNEHQNYSVTRDGRRRLIKWFNTVLPDEDGGIQHVIVTGIDVTEEEQTRQLPRNARDALEQRVAEQTAELALATSKRNGKNQVTVAP